MKENFYSTTSEVTAESSEFWRRAAEEGRRERMIQVTREEVVEQWRRGGYAAPWSGSL